jgi:hypothetical protein
MRITVRRCGKSVEETLSQDRQHETTKGTHVRTGSRNHPDSIAGEARNCVQETMNRGFDNSSQDNPMDLREQKRREGIA